MSECKHTKIEMDRHGDYNCSCGKDISQCLLDVLQQLDKANAELENNIAQTSCPLCGDTANSNEALISKKLNIALLELEALKQSKVDVERPYVEVIKDGDIFDIVGFRVDGCISILEYVNNEFNAADIDGTEKDGVYVLDVIFHQPEFCNGGLVNGGWVDFKVKSYMSHDDYANTLSSKENKDENK